MRFFHIVEQLAEDAVLKMSVLDIPGPDKFKGVVDQVVDALDRSDDFEGKSEEAEKRSDERIAALRWMAEFIVRIVYRRLVRSGRIPAPVQAIVSTVADESSKPKGRKQDTKADQKPKQDAPEKG